MGFASGTWICIARRTRADERAMVVRTAKSGYPVFPVSWIAKVVKARGVDREAARAWYQAMSQRIATAGRATGLVQFSNGNASAVLFEVHQSDADADIDLSATMQFMKAGEYAPDAWGPVVSGAEGIERNRAAPHSGISAVDLLQQLKPVKGPVVPTTL